MTTFRASAARARRGGRDRLPARRRAVPADKKVEPRAALARLLLPLLLLPATLGAQGDALTDAQLRDVFQTDLAALKAKGLAGSLEARMVGSLEEPLRSKLVPPPQAATKPPSLQTSKLPRD